MTPSQYGLELYDDPPSHDQLTAVAQDVPACLGETGDWVPDSPRSSIVLTDLAPGTLLVPGGTVNSTVRPFRETAYNDTA